MKIKGSATHQPQCSASPSASPKDLSIIHSKRIRGMKGENRNAQRVAKAFSLLVGIWFFLFVWGVRGFWLLFWGFCLGGLLVFVGFVSFCFVFEEAKINTRISNKKIVNLH